MINIIIKILASKAIRELIVRLTNKYSVGAAAIIAAILGIENLPETINITKDTLNTGLESTIAAYFLAKK